MKVKLYVDFVSSKVRGGTPKTAQWVREIEMDYPPTKGLIIPFDFTHPDGKADTVEFEVDVVVYDPEAKKYIAHYMENVPLDVWGAKIDQRRYILPGWEWVE